MCPGQGRNIRDASGECLCGDGDIALQSQKPEEPPDHAGGRSYWWDPASPLPLPRAGETDGARRRKGGEPVLPAGSAGWHLSSLTCGPTASHRPFLAPCRLSPAASPPPADRNLIPWPGWEQGGEDRLPRAPDPPQQSAGLLPGSPCQARV